MIILKPLFGESGVCDDSSQEWTKSDDGRLVSDTGNLARKESPPLKIIVFDLNVQRNISQSSVLRSN